MRKPSVISLFTGAGGLDIGFHAAGLRTAVAVEMDHACCQTLRANKARGYTWEVIERKLEEVSSKEILAAARLKPREADVLIGGPPCQPFSKSGYWATGDARRLRDPRANTLREYLRILRDAQPKAFVLENVSGLAYTGKEEGLRFLFREIEEINRCTGTRYKVVAKLLNAADYGVPQTRERLILVGARDGTELRFLDPTFFDPSQKRAGEPWRTAWDALGDLPTPDDVEECRVTGRWADLLPSIPEGWNYQWHTDRGRSGVHLFGWRRRYWSFLLKLAKSRPSWTLTAQPGPAIGPFHWKNRRLARAELLRIQTFPDGYDVVGNLRDVQRQVGNAVPSLLAQTLAIGILSQLLRRSRHRSPPLLRPAPKRAPAKPERFQDVVDKYLPFAGTHAPHPGTGLGFGALRRTAG